MSLKRNMLLVFGLLLGGWLLVLAWQIEEHEKVKESARTDLRKSSKAIASTVGAFIRGLQFRGAVVSERLEPALNELVNASTNELVKSGDLVSIALLNAAGDRLASAGKPIDLAQAGIVQEGERWGRNTVTMVYPVEGASVAPEGTTNPTTVVLPPFRELTNTLPEGFRGRFGRRETRPEGPGPGPPAPPPEGMGPPPPGPDGADSGRTNVDRHDDRARSAESRPRRPFWARGLDEEAYQALVKKRELHGLVLAMSTDTFEAICRRDLWLRSVIAFFAGISAVGAGVAWRNLSKSSELQIRLVRASELNTHLKEMNLAAAGLAHETRNPLNIIRGLAQMISRRPDAPPEVRNKSREIIDETDKVTAQLNEFINYSRPRELRRSVLALHSVVNEVVRALNYDIEEKTNPGRDRGRTARDRGGRTTAAAGAVQPGAQRHPGRRRGRRDPDPHAAAGRRRGVTGSPRQRPRRSAPTAAPRFSNPTSPPSKRAPAWAWRSCSRSCWRTAGKSNAFSNEPNGARLPHHAPAPRAEALNWRIPMEPKGEPREQRLGPITASARRSPAIGKLVRGAAGNRRPVPPGPNPPGTDIRAPG